MGEDAVTKKSETPQSAPEAAVHGLHSREVEEEGDELYRNEA